MNQRIRELAEQAGYEPDVCGIHLDPRIEWFAKYIIEECASVAVQDDEPNLLANPHMDLNGAYTAGKVSASLLIQQHFGIE